MRLVPIYTSEACFSKVPKSFRARPENHNKILNLKFTELFFSHIFYTNNVNFHAKFNAYTLLSFEIQIIKNGFTGPISYRLFRETGSRFERDKVE